MRIDATASAWPAGTARTPKGAAVGLLVSLLVALAASTLSPPLHAAGGVSAVPEFIELGEAELQTPGGAALASAQEAFRERLGDDDPAAALDIAKRIVALTAEVCGESHDNFARALSNLAIVQAEDANFGAAVENYIAAIQVREQAIGSIVSRDLVNPLRGLASAYLALDQVERAIPVYERAIHISHVNDGPENLDQVEIIDALSRAHYFSGDLEAAGDMQDAIFRLRERRAEEDPEQYLDALDQRSDWYVRLGDYEAAIRSYRRLRRALSEQYGNEDARLIEPLVALADAVLEQIMDADRRRARGISITTGSRSPAADRIGGLSDPRTFRQLVAESRRCQTAGCVEAILGDADASGRALREGRSAMNRAVRIARAHSAEHPELLARTLVRQADWLTLLDQTRDARRRYRDAWKILDGDPALHATRDELFGAPVSVARVAFRQAHGERTSRPVDPLRYPDRGHADVAFDVDKRGRPRNVRIVSADPAGLMDKHVLRQMRRVRFRPAIGDGEPQAYAGLVYRHTFRYDASGLTDDERETMATTTYDDGAASDAPALRSIDLNPRRDDWLAGDAAVARQAAPAEAPDG